MRKETVTVTFWVSLAIIAASIEPIIVKLGYASNMAPMQLLVVKCIVGGILILPLTRTWRWIGWSGAWQISKVSMLLLCTNALTLIALKFLPAVTVILVATTTPALVALVNRQLGRDVLGPRFWLGFVLCLAGVLLGLHLQDLSFCAAGFVPIILAVISSTIYRVRMEGTTQTYSPALVSTYVFLINSLVCLLFIAPWVGSIPISCWAVGAWIGLAAAAANVAFLYALHLLGSTRISIINMLQRPTIIIAAALILKEHLTFGNIVGVAFVLVGIQMAAVSRNKFRPSVLSVDAEAAIEQKLSAAHYSELKA